VRIRMGHFVLDLAPMRSWGEFIEAACRPESIRGSARHKSGSWSGAKWDEALRLAVEGWHVPLADVNMNADELSAYARLHTGVPALELTADVAGGEVDVAAYLSGVPECMIEASLHRMHATRRMVSFLIPGIYSSRTQHHEVINRGLAMAALCTGVVRAGHSLEVWTSYSGLLGSAKRPFNAAAKVIDAGEPFDVGRLIFAVAHPAMLRRLWFGVWDAQPAATARLFKSNRYGRSHADRPGVLPEDIAGAMVFPVLEPAQPQWQSQQSALAWCRRTFTELALDDG
jgi:hypothetical protein